MRRQEILNSINKVRTAIEKSELLDSLEKFIRPAESSSSPTFLLNSFRLFTIEYEKFNVNERQILSIFELDNLNEADLWSKMYIADKGDRRESFYKIRYNLKFLYDMMPKVLEIFKQEIQEYVYQDATVLNDNEILTVILPEDDKKFSSPIRLSELINSIILIYQSFAIITNKSQDDLSVISIDSGSDKSFDFMGNAEVVKCIKEFFIELWDRIVFFRERLIGERIELIGKSLPVLEKISIMEQNGSIGPEQAEILRRNIVESTRKIISTGAIIPEIEKYSSYNPRVLMSPERKMLKESNQTDNLENHSRKTEKAESDMTNLSEEEQEKLKELLNKLNNK
jgi:hypothetical protein